MNIKKVAARRAQESCMWPRSAAIHCAACRVYCSCLNHPFGFIKRKSHVWDIHIVLLFLLTPERRVNSTRCST